MTNQLKALGAVLALAFSLNASATLVIDSFSSTQAKIEDGTVGGPIVSSQLADATVLGGYRELIVSKTGGFDAAAAADTTLTTSLAVGGGKLRFSNDNDVSGVGIARWDGSATGGAINATGLGGASLLAYGNAFVIDVISSDPGATFNFILEAYTNAGQYSSYTLAGTGVGIYSITFADLLGAGATTVGGGVDVTNLGALQLTILPMGASTFGLDLAIDTISVPEPASLALVGLSLLGLGVMRRRQA